ncbi:MAG TPA: SDR family oxidoreductase [Solirubrobacterales bacterium]|jgi:NAD(P)-dependent dehydrogenase (short-subunit alcohol dehydrogenase family)
MAERSEKVPSPEGRGEAPGRGRLEGRRVLVVGGGQEEHALEDPPIGNGRAMSILFGREGAAVAVADLNGASAEATAERVRAEGAAAEVIVADAADEAASAGMFEAAAEALGGLDGVVMNVGIGAGFAIRGTSAEDWDRVMAVNLRAHFLGCKNALATMGDGGALVLMGSIAATEVMPWPAYAASKAALESLCRQAAVEGAPRVRTNLIHPGLIDTSLGRLASQVSPLRDQVRIPAGRQGTGWEIAYGALFLLSGESSYMTGQILILDGGLTVGPRAG